MGVSLQIPDYCRLPHRSTGRIGSRLSKVWHEGCNAGAFPPGNGISNP